MSEWKNYTNDRVIFESPDGFYVIKPKDFKKSRPIFCPLCDVIMVTKMDEESYSKFECCDSCATYWAYPNKAKWSEGWRPTAEEVLNKYKVSHT